MKQNEITVPTPLLRDDGQLTAPGCSNIIARPPINAPL